MKCPNCKNPTDDKASVCEWCGTSLQAPSTLTIKKYISGLDIEAIALLEKGKKKTLNGDLRIRTKTKTIIFYFFSIILFILSFVMIVGGIGSILNIGRSQAASEAGFIIFFMGTGFICIFFGIKLLRKGSKKGRS